MASYTRSFQCTKLKKVQRHQLRNKFHQLRIRQREFSKLIKEAGINYNSVSGTGTASEVVWQKVKKSARKMSKKGCPFFNKLSHVRGCNTERGSNLQYATGSAHEIENLNMSTSFSGQSDGVGTSHTDLNPSSSNRGKEQMFLLL